ncbi:ABC transporter permease subunit [Massilibacteroides sp.]|uniref:ABC transporter permease subunit n=1 Tax=Massilibacteroides sp. TaxID=2034766 RepID=UPI002616843D|nr:ABC transporter permease subunit [Massilibacteroides sp.]MDD4516069.1 ABC transporter permease subunit [Massilibacteroides sp.]
MKNKKHTEKRQNPFTVIVQKEISDQVRSLRFLILLAIIVLTCTGAMYTALTNIAGSVKPNDPEGSFFFLKLFTISDGTMPSFLVFITFLGPVLGICMGFDAINSERNRGTLSFMLAQPIPRDYLINAKFTAAFIVISILLFALGFLTTGLGLIIVGIPPTVDEFFRIVLFLLIACVYVAFWLNLSILLSVQCKQAATSALAAIAIWLFFSVFYNMLVNLIAKGIAPSEFASANQMVYFQRFVLDLLRVDPAHLFNEATSALLIPSVRSLGPLTMEQMVGSLPTPLSLGQSLAVVWPQLTGLIAATVICFALSYVSFMRREIRSR